jgi:hypothetical protein
LRPARLFSLIVYSSPCDLIVVTRRRLRSGEAAAGGESVALRSLGKSFRLTGMNGAGVLLPVRSFFRLRFFANLTLVQ